MPGETEETLKRLNRPVTGPSRSGVPPGETGGPGNPRGNYNGGDAGANTGGGGGGNGGSSAPGARAGNGAVGCIIIAYQPD